MWGEGHNKATHKMMCLGGLGMSVEEYDMCVRVWVWKVWVCRCVSGSVWMCLWLYECEYVCECDCVCESGSVCESMCEYMKMSVCVTVGVVSVWVCVSVSMCKCGRCECESGSVYGSGSVANSDSNVSKKKVNLNCFLWTNPTGVKPICDWSVNRRL